MCSFLFHGKLHIWSFSLKKLHTYASLWEATMMMDEPIIICGKIQCAENNILWAFFLTWLALKVDACVFLKIASAHYFFVLLQFELLCNVKAAPLQPRPSSESLWNTAESGTHRNLCIYETLKLEFLIVFSRLEALIEDPIRPIFNSS